jgi:multisubunit Na+/H+ antiporter MnhB subunit
VNRSNYRTRHASTVPGWGPAPGWDQPLPGWTPLLDHGPLPLRAAGSLARWWWPTLAVAGFLAVAVYVTGHDPGLSQRGLLTIALAALVVVLLTIHRTAGPSRLARAAAEYTAVALLAALLTLTAGGNQPPTTPAAKGESKYPATARPEANQDRPWVIRVAASVIRAVTRAIRAVTGAVGWLVDLWHQADATTEPPNRSSSTTPKAKAISPSPASAATSTRRST